MIPSPFFDGFAFFDSRARETLRLIYIPLVL